jgi:hypothetical protein
LVRINGTPIMLAASSSSRMASQARPSRPSRIRIEANSTSAVRAQKMMNFGSTSNGPRSPHVSAPVSSNLKKRTESTGVMPCVPLEMFWPNMWSPL